MFMRVLYHHDGRIHHRADCNRDAAQTHDVGIQPQRMHGDKRDQHADRQHHDRHQRAACVHQKHHAHQCHDQAFFEQSLFQCGDGALNQLGAVIDAMYRNAFGQARGDLGDLVLDVAYHFQRVLPVARHNDARHHLPFAVEFGQSAPLVRPEFDTCDIAQQHRRTEVGFHHQILDVAFAAQITQASHHVLGLGHLDHAPAHITVGIAYHLRDLAQRDAICAQLHRIDRHLVLLHKTADGSDLRHAVRLGQLIAQIPVLHGAQFGEIVFVAQHRILIHPAHAGRVRPQLRRDVFRQTPRDAVEIFQHARTRPVDIGAVLEDHVHERRAEEREAAHHLGFRHSQHRRGERIGDLVFHHLRGLPRVFGIDDHLHIRQIWQRIQGHLEHGIAARQYDEQSGEQHQKTIARRPIHDVT